MGDKIRGLLRPAGPPPNGASLPPSVSGPLPFVSSAMTPAESDRPSNGLRQFFDNVRGARLQILDLGGACQANVNFITSQGHKLYSEDLLVCMERLSTATRAGLSQRFLEETLDFPGELFDGVLVWDTLEFLDEEILAAVVTRFQAIVKPGGTLLAFFHTQSKGQTVPVFRYQIQNPQTLRLNLRFSRPLPRAFNNRHLERLFAQFRAVKFFLAKDGLREVIVTR